MARKGSRLRCPYDRKTIFTSRKIATRTAHRVPDTQTRIYWCKPAGGYHITRFEVGEYDRRQAVKLRGKGATELNPQEEEVVVPEGIGRGGDCPTCGWLGGFHDSILHSYLIVPESLTWKPGRPAPWENT